MAKSARPNPAAGLFESAKTGSTGVRVDDDKKAKTETAPPVAARVPFPNEDVVRRKAGRTPAPDIAPGERLVTTSISLKEEQQSWLAMESVTRYGKMDKSRLIRELIDTAMK